MTKRKGQEAIEKALDEHGVTGEAPEAKATTESEEKVSAAPEGEVVEKPEESEESPSPEPEAAPVEEEAPPADEKSAEPSESVQKLVDAALQRSLAKHGRQTDSEKSGTDRDVYNALLDDIAKRMNGKGVKREAQRLAEVDLTNPDAVQEFFDRRIEAAITSKVKPYIQKSELKELDAEFSAFASKHPDYQKYGKAMADLLDDARYKDLPLEHLYRIVSHDAKAVAGREEAYSSMQKKKLANLESNTAKPKASESVAKVKNAREAVMRAMEEVGATFGDH